ARQAQAENGEITPPNHRVCETKVNPTLDQSGLQHFVSLRRVKSQRSVSSEKLQHKHPLSNVNRQGGIFHFQKQNAPKPFTSRLLRRRLTLKRPPNKQNRYEPSK